MGGLYCQTNALKRPTATGDMRTTYGVVLTRFSVLGSQGDPGYLTREELTAIRDHLTFTLEDSED